MRAALPLRVTPVPRETLTSFLARMAAVNGVSGRDFAVDMGFSLRKIIDLDEIAIRRLAVLGNLDDQCLAEVVSWSGRNVGGVKTVFRGEVFVSRALRNPRIRGCPVCLREDASAHDGPVNEAMAMRGDWQLREVSLCVRHHHPLVQLWEMSTPLQRYDIGQRLTEVKEQILNGDLDHDRAIPSPYDEWLDRRLHDSRDTTWLAKHSLYAATTFCRILGKELLRLEKPQYRNEMQEQRAAQAAGFAVAKSGEDAIRSALRDLTNLATGANDEPSKAFGSLFSALSRDYINEEGFTIFRNLLREQILETWPVAAGEVVVGEVLPERRLHSVLSAARETSLWPPLLDKLLLEAGAFSENDERPNSRKTFDARQYSLLLDDIPQLVGQAQMQHVIGASKAELLSLAKDEILLPRTALPTVKSRWHPADGLKLLAELKTKAIPIEVDDEAWEGMQDAKNRTGLNLRAILTEIDEGSLQIGHRRGSSGYQAFHVNKDEIDSLAGRLGLLPSPDLTPLSTFGWSIGIRGKGHLLALISAGYMPATRMQFPKSGGARFYMTTADIAAFHKRFVTLKTLASEVGEHRNTILARFRVAGVRLFSPEGESFGSLYLRSEAEKAFPPQT